MLSQIKDGIFQENLQAFKCFWKAYKCFYDITHRIQVKQDRYSGRKLPQEPFPASLHLQSEVRRC